MTWFDNLAPSETLKLPDEPQTFELTCDVRLDGADLQRFCDAGGVISSPGWRIFVDGTLDTALVHARPGGGLLFGTKRNVECLGGGGGGVGTIALISKREP